MLFSSVIRSSTRLLSKTEQIGNIFTPQRGVFTGPIGSNFGTKLWKSGTVATAGGPNVGISLFNRSSNIFKPQFTQYNAQRFYARGGKKPNVLTFIKKEQVAVQDEEVNFEHLDAALKNGWKPEVHKYGSYTLRKDNKGEQIEVKFYSEHEVERQEFEEDEEEPPRGLENQYDFFQVTIRKSDRSQYVTIDCYANRGVLEVADITTFDSKDNSVIARVRVDELEEEGQEAFFDYLEERGIDNNFCFVVSDGLESYRRDDYNKWLSSLENFLK
jgi:hypothetical protein